MEICLKNDSSKIYWNPLKICANNTSPFPSIGFDADAPPFSSIEELKKKESLEIGQKHIENGKMNNSQTVRQ